MKDRHAIIISIGDEIVLGQKLDTNSPWLAQRLLEHGVETIEHHTVGDDRGAIARVIAAAVTAADVVVTTGGLGPTDDDVTREAVGDVVDPAAALVTDPGAERHLRGWFRDRVMPEGNLRQAMRPASMQAIPNPHGTALGLAGRYGDTRIFVLPGPPREMRPMVEASVAPELGGSGRVILTRLVHSFGLGESAAADMLGDLTTRSRSDLVGTTASGGIVTARLRASGTKEDAEKRLAADVLDIETRWGPYAFGVDEQTLAASVVVALAEQGATLATAESCTGGLLGSMLVDVAGASRVYRGGWVTYSNALKQSCLGVSAGLIDEAGAVSRPVATAMAEGGRNAAGATYALSITGVAGPDGGTPGKPAGTVYIGLATPTTPTIVRHFRFRGERGLVRDRSAMCALQLLRFALIGHGDAPLLGQVTSS